MLYYQASKMLELELLKRYSIIKTEIKNKNKKQGKWKWICNDDTIHVRKLYHKE